MVPPSYLRSIPRPGADLEPVSSTVSTKPPSDEEVVEGLTRGERWAAEELYTRLHPAVSRTLRRVLRSAPNDRRSHMDHDDLVQIAFENIIKTLIQRRFANACKLTTWASAIAGHVGVDALRSLYRENRALATLTDHDSRIHGQPGRSVEQSIEARSELQRVQSVLGRMSKDQARAVVLHDVLGHDLSEVAVIAGVSISAAQSRLFRGRREMLRRAARS